MGLDRPDNSRAGQPQYPEKDALTVVLTGSTGNLGTYILDNLLSHSSIKKVYCFNRSRDAPRKQDKAFRERDLSCAVIDAVRFFNVDYARSDLGLQPDEYEHVKEEVDLIIHNAWPIDFNYRFSSFQPSIDGVRNLIMLAKARQTGLNHRRTNQCSGTKEPIPPRILFTSSIGAASNWATYAASSRDKIPEVELIEWKLARTGYGQSKLVSERLLARAARTFGIPVCVVRIGQMAGPIQHGEFGAWPRQEWVPSLIHSSVALGAIPGDLGPNEAVDWVPVDMAAGAIVELALQTDTERENVGTRKKEAQFFHVSNKTLTAWSDILPTMCRYLPEEIRVVNIIEWVDLLEKAVREKASGESKNLDEGSVPALKLWDNFEYIRDRAKRFPGSTVVTLDTSRSVKHSQTLATLQSVNPAWVELWMKQWGYCT